MTWLFRWTGWKMFTPARAPWGESTFLWTDGDWRWFRRYGAPWGYLKASTVPPLTADEIARGGRYNDPQ